MGVKETAINVAPLHSIFVSKYLDHGNNRPKTTCVSSGTFFSFSYGEAMQYFISFESYVLFLL